MTMRKIDTTCARCDQTAQTHTTEGPAGDDALREGMGYRRSRDGRLACSLQCELDLDEVFARPHLGGNQ